jgi:hypothetical protein
MEVTKMWNKQTQWEKLMEEVENRMCNKCHKKEHSHLGLWVGIAVAIVAGVVGVVLWLRSKKEDDLDEYYQYFEDELDEEVEDDLYGEDEEDVEYVELKNFKADEENGKDE